MSFRNPALLLFVLPLIALTAYVFKQIQSGRYNATLRVSSDNLFRLQSAVHSPRIWTLFGFFIGSVFLIIALARPQTSFQKVKKVTEGIDITIVLDMSASMRVEDFRDTNRMEVAKKVIKEFISNRISDRIGLVAFSGEAVTLAPPTLDYNLVLQQLSNIEIGDLKDGTAIGEGLALAVTRLHASKTKTKIAILVTDGDNNMGQIDPSTAGEMAKGYGVKVYSIAIGRDGRVRMPFVQKDLFGRSFKTYQYYDSSINPELLKQISAATGGKFYRVQDDETVFRDVFKDIDSLEKTVMTSSEQVKYQEKYFVFLQLGLFIIAATWFLQFTALRVYP